MAPTSALTTLTVPAPFELTPREIDTLLSPLYQTRSGLLSRIQAAQTYAWRYTKNVLSTTAQAEVDRAKAKLAEVEAEIAPYHAEYDRRGGWTRAFVVPVGHVHSSMACSSCYSTTQFFWLPQYSGGSEAVIVDDAGERACTICYPSAPVDTLARATRIFTDSERKDVEVRAIRQAVMAEKAAVRAAKAITSPDGSPLRTKTNSGRNDTYLVKTEREARIEAADATLDIARFTKTAEHLRAFGPGSYHLWTLEDAEARVARSKSNLDLVVAAIAAKHGWTTEEALADLKPSMDRKLKQWVKEGSW
jgi:hypothetical protein